MKKIIITLFLVLFIIGCQTTIPESTDSLNSEQINSLNVDEDIKEIAEDSLEQPLPLSSKDKIQTAYNNNDISREEWALLTFLSSYAPDQLPSSYQGEKSTNLRNQLQEAKWWLNENYEDLNSDWQDSLKPFYVLPDNPESIFNQEEHSFLEKLSLIPSVSAQTSWDYFESTISTSPERKVRILYRPTDYQKALYVNETMYKAWTMHENLLGVRPDKSVYVFIKPMADGAGEAEMKDENGKRCVIGLSSTTGKKELQSTAAHELFHCFQFAIPLKYEQEDTMWLMEATASWVESYVYPDYNIEFMYLPYHFKNLHTYMIQHNGDKEYSAYTWYYFLTQFTGDLNQIKEPLFNAKTQGGTVAATSINYFDTFWAEYALWNWNKVPWEQYADIPSFPTGTWKGYKMNPQGQNLESREYSTQEEFPLYEPIKPLSMTYQELIFPSDDVKKALFKFDKEGNSLHARQALIKIGDVWHLEDWTYIKERKFCRTRDEEKVKAVVLIFSNADSNKNAGWYDEKFTLDTREECSPEWHGYTRWHYGYSWEDTIDGGVLLSAALGYSMSTSYSAYETLVYDDEEDEFVVKEQFLNFYRRESSNAMNLNDCGTMEKGSNTLWSGTYSKSWDIDEKRPSRSDAPVRMSVNWNNPAQYDVDVSLVPGDEFISYQDHTFSTYKPCPLEGLFTPVGGSSSSSSDSSRMTYLPYSANDVMADLSNEGNRISATITEQGSAGSTNYPIIVEVDYRYG